jgi:large subunit ribosomal protein L17
MARGPGALPDKEARQQWSKNFDVIRILFDEIAPAFKNRNGGYTRVVRIGARPGDAAEIAILEWTDVVVKVEAPKTEGDKKAEAKADATAEKKPAKRATKKAKTETAKA